MLEPVLSRFLHLVLRLLPGISEFEPVVAFNGNLAYTGVSFWLPVAWIALRR